MSDITYIRQKYNEINENANADDVPICVMKQVVKAYEKGRADVLNELMDIRIELSLVNDESITKLFGKFEQLKEQKKMPLSLKCKIDKLEHKGQITKEEHRALLKKLDGHDKQIRADAIEEFIKAIEKHQTRQDSYLDPPYIEMGVDMADILEIAEQLKEQKNE